MNEFFPEQNQSAVSAPRKPAQPGAGMRPSAFVREVAAIVEPRLKSAGLIANLEVRSRLLKIWYGPEQDVHYELSLHENYSQLEIGLHAESTAESNRAFYDAFDKCMVEIQRELGSSIWLEEWDRGWMRLYETQPLWPLDSSRADDVVARIVEIITVIEPIYRAIL